MLESQAKFEAERLSQQIFTISGEIFEHLAFFLIISIVTRIHRILGRSRENPLRQERAQEKGPISI